MGNAARKTPSVRRAAGSEQQSKSEKQQRKSERKASQRSQSVKARPKDCAWDRKLLQRQLYAAGHVTHAVIAGFDDLQLRAVVPPDFAPDEQGKSFVPRHHGRKQEQ